MLPHPQGCERSKSLKSRGQKKEREENRMEKDNKFKNMTTNQLKEEYISCTFGSMIYRANTETRRKELSKEIERRETTMEK